MMCLVTVDNDHVDGQLANAAGELPNKPHEWMMSNLLSPYSRTLGMQARNDSGGCGKRTVSGFINAEDNEATEQKTKQMAVATSPGLAHHPKMGATSAPLDLLQSTIPLPSSGELAARVPPRLPVLTQAAAV